MEKRIKVITILGVCLVGLAISSTSLIQVANASQDLVLHMVYAVETGTSVLFYIFFIRGVNPDCIELVPDDEHQNSEY